MNVYIIEVSSRRAELNSTQHAGYLTECFYSANHAMEWATQQANKWINQRRDRDRDLVVKVEEVCVKVFDTTHRWHGLWGGALVRCYKLTCLKLHGSVVDALADVAPKPTLWSRMKSVFA